MKIIITERQYRMLLESKEEYGNAVKNLIHKIWQNEIDSTGEINLDIDIAKYLNYTPKGDQPTIHEMYRDFLGGWDKMVEKSHQLMDRVFDTRDYDFSGGYNFRFTVKGGHEYEEDNGVYVDCPIESDGKVTLMNGETHLLKDVEEDEDLWWEIDSEIRSLIEDILYVEVTKKTGIMVDVNMLWIKE